MPKFGLLRSFDHQLPLPLSIKDVEATPNFLKHAYHPNWLGKLIGLERKRVENDAKHLLADSERGIYIFNGCHVLPNARRIHRQFWVFHKLPRVPSRKKDVRHCEHLPTFGAWSHRSNGIWCLRTIGLRFNWICSDLIHSCHWPRTTEHPRTSLSTKLNQSIKISVISIR